MTKKQYKRRVMETLRMFNQSKVKSVTRKRMMTDRIGVPKWGAIISAGPHKGEVLRSYEQAWDSINAIINGTN